MAYILYMTIMGIIIILFLVTIVVACLRRKKSSAVHDASPEGEQRER